jgi:hypothetical protein
MPEGNLLSDPNFSLLRWNWPSNKYHGLETGVELNTFKDWRQKVAESIDTTGSS